ncbi:DJ-1/PfpI family protein [Agaribacterium haliotis]|uniref:DJ-1/PfpI family protein n=1 Tax=Agaribacterium haliotis TaxID=2013869 RepID=UPI000BB5534C|nr:DJ-1/PfpI family protein [Agaribacterium haliotis]
MNIAIYIYDEAEVLDFSGPFEVFSTAARISDEADVFNVFLVSEHGGTVSARGAYKVQADYSFEGHPDIDVLIVVGGVHNAEMGKEPVLNWIQAQAKTAKLVASVCTGVFLLAKAGLVSTQKVTTHWQDIADLRAAFPDLDVVENQRWVDEGSVVSSGGISAGIDMSLHLVSKLHSRELAHKTARQMEFDWTQNREGKT